MQVHFFLETTEFLHKLICHLCFQMQCYKNVEWTAGNYLHQRSYTQWYALIIIMLVVRVCAISLYWRNFICVGCEYSYTNTLIRKEDPCWNKFWFSVGLILLIFRASLILHSTSVLPLLIILNWSMPKLFLQELHLLKCCPLADLSARKFVSTWIFFSD